MARRKSNTKQRDAKAAGAFTQTTAGPARAESQPNRTTTMGVVLAGTQSWGACPLERILPRALAPIVNYPLLFYVLDWLDQGGIQQVNICGSNNTRTLRQSLSNGHSSHVPAEMRIDYYHDISPRGPAGCVRDAGSAAEFDQCVVVDGTVLPQINLADVLAAHYRSGAALTVVVSAQNASAAGCANGPTDEHLTPTGVYVFSRRVLKHVPPAGYQDIKEALIPRLYQCGESVLTYRTDAPAPRVTGVDSYLAVNEWAVAHSLERSDRLAGYRTLGEAMVHPTASVESTARLVGPIVVGANSSIAQGVTIVGPTTIGANCRIAKRAVVCRTAIWDGAAVGAGAMVDRCIVTYGADVRDDVPHRYVVLSPAEWRFGGLGRTD